MCFFFFKQKTAYEMRISDWSSDVCSSDLLRRGKLDILGRAQRIPVGVKQVEREERRRVANRGAVGRIELDALGEIIVGVLPAQGPREDDLADRLLLRPAAGARDAGDRDRDVGVAVRQRARGHRPSGGERSPAEGFAAFAAPFALDRNNL